MAPEKGELRQVSREDEARTFLHEEADIEDTKCGIGSFKPQWLQCMAKKEVYMIVFSVVGLTQGIFFTYMVSVLSTIEKRFKFTSKETGTILSGNDVSQIILSIVLGYYGTFGHRPRWVGMGVFFAALSGFAAALPHFLYGPGEQALAIARAATAGATPDLLDNITSLTSHTKKEELCFFQPEENCGEDGSGRDSREPFMDLSSSSSSLSSSLASPSASSTASVLPTWTITLARRPTLSLAFMLRVMGPVCGFFVGGKCLSLWIDPSVQPNLTRKDPRWYGAWWIGFLIIGFGLLLTGNFLFLFPRKLPETLKREARKIVRQADKDDKDGGGQRGVEYFASLVKNKKTEEKPTMKNLLKALKRLFTNKIWVGNLFNTTTYLIGVAGYWNFKPKYLETQYRQSATTASYYTGMASFVSLVLGTGLGGAVLRWAQPGPRFVTGYNIFITLFTCCSYIVLSSIGCPRLDIIGPVDGSLPPNCSTQCGCSDKFSPVCAEDQSTLYYSACYAGCSTMNGASYGSGSSGYCPEPCGNFIYYIVIQMAIKTVASTGRVGSNLINLRSVAEEDKGIALAFIFISVFGDIVVFYYSRQLDLYGKKEDEAVLGNGHSNNDGETQPLTDPQQE
ncbi:Solute carrier organic anion transporter family member 74D-like 3 [Homarus americanus]|uniref:Solute carrier organic anion transporter family member 74D-like 3 n=1 Tax=Homarus americanus TaxID=6706 RepID=A0A8J5THP3_HOMAM|nr:Solute carrier organic anion transporter family member 74D-like 3 [Homarus americanus]